MKKILSSLSILSVLLMFNACSEKEGTLFDFGGKDFWSFHSAKQTLEADETGKVNVYLYHLGASTSITPVELTVEYETGSEGVLSVAATSFNSVDKDGKAVIEITYNIEDLEYNVPYKLTISISEQPDYPVEESLVSSVLVTVIRPLTFKSLGVGTFISEAFEDEWDQPVLLADQTPLYQLPNLYDNGYPINIIDNGDGTVTVELQPAWNYNATYGDVYVVGDGIKEGNVITLELEHILLSANYSFGAYEEILILPEE